MIQQAFFITGTDTGVGKTTVACQLIRHYAALGYKVIGMKPVAAGEDYINGEWINDDVLKLAAASNVQAPRALTNPYSFKPAIAPHIAAEFEGVEIKIEVIKQAFEQLKKLADIVIVEGAGGFLVPINSAKYNQQTMADLAAVLNVPIILVAGIKLGCINHTLLTIEAIKMRKIAFEGWIANQIDPEMLSFNKNVETIAKITQLNYLHLYTWQAA